VLTVLCAVCVRAVCVCVSGRRRRRSWRAATQLAGPVCDVHDPAVECFWSTIGQLTQEERGKVLAFATGCPRLPTVAGTAPIFVLHINRQAVRRCPPSPPPPTITRTQRERESC
jgi:hypothetical protein